MHTGTPRSPWTTNEITSIVRSQLSYISSARNKPSECIDKRRRVQRVCYLSMYCTTGKTRKQASITFKIFSAFLDNKGTEHVHCTVRQRWSFTKPISWQTGHFLFLRQASESTTDHTLMNNLSNSWVTCYDPKSQTSDLDNCETTTTIPCFLFFFSNNAHSSELNNVVHGRYAWSAGSKRLIQVPQTDEDVLECEITTGRMSENWRLSRRDAHQSRLEGLDGRGHAAQLYDKTTLSTWSQCCACPKWRDVFDLHLKMTFAIDHQHVISPQLSMKGSWL